MKILLYHRLKSSYNFTISYKIEHKIRKNSKYKQLKYLYNNLEPIT